MGNAGVNLNTYMKSFKEYLYEGSGGRIFGIDPFGPRSQTEVMKFAQDVGYKVEHGPKHIKIINPVSGQLVAAMSHGANRSEYNERYALKNITRDLERSGSNLRPTMDAKTVGSRIRSSPRPMGTAGFPRAAVMPSQFAAQVAGQVLAAPVQRAGEETGFIDAIARGISAIVPTDILASGPSPAELEREEMEHDEEMRRQGLNPRNIRNLPL